MDTPVAETKSSGLAAVQDKTPSGWTAGSMIVLLGGMVLAGWCLRPGLNLVVVTALMALGLLVLGVAITKRPMGVLINDRNLVSLSRLQMAMWTVAILAAYFTFALMRIKASVADPLAIQIDWHLWALMGISATSLVGTPLILSTKKDKEPDPAIVPRTSQLVGEPAAAIEANREGTLYANATLADARFTDIFQGDELKNTAHIDLAKVQMFYFTMIAVVCFFVMVLNAATSSNADLSRLPELPDGLIAVLGISNAGYLTSKGIDHTKLKS